MHGCLSHGNLKRGVRKYAEEQEKKRGNEYRISIGKHGIIESFGLWGQSQSQVSAQKFTRPGLFSKFFHLS